MHIEVKFYNFDIKKEQLFIKYIVIRDVDMSCKGDCYDEISFEKYWII